MNPDASHALLVIPHVHRDGFWASIRGHVLELADPSGGEAFAPTPDDLFTASIASDLAWFARTFLRDHGVSDDVNVSATWQTLRESAEIDLTVTVPTRASAVREALEAAVESRIAARYPANPVVHISCEE